MKCTVCSLSLSLERSRAAAATRFLKSRDLNRRHLLGLILVYTLVPLASPVLSLQGALRLALQRPIQDMLAAVVDLTALPAPICADAGAPALRTRRSVSRVSNSCLTRIAFDGSAAPPSLSASSLSYALTCEGIGISSCCCRRSSLMPYGLRV